MATPLLAQSPAPAAPPFTFGGVMYANFQTRDDSAGRASNGGRPINRFDIDRLYLTFGKQVGNADTVFVTTDIYQQPDTTKNGFYRGWAIRLKYGYLQYNLGHDILGQPGSDAVARLGMIHTVIIPHLEAFWPRWLGPTGPEKYGFSVGADVGAAGLLKFPRRWGEALTTITNGTGFQSPEVDRFKDFALRVSLTPFGNDSAASFRRTLTLTSWGSLGAGASKFVNGGPGQLGPVGSALRRNRWGVLSAVRDRRFTGGLEYARKIDGVETGENTLSSPVVVANRAGQLLDGFALVRPLELLNHGQSRFGLIGRADRFEPDVIQDGREDFVVAGLFWETSIPPAGKSTPATTLSLDFQRLRATALTNIPEQRTLFVHWQATF